MSDTTASLTPQDQRSRRSPIRRAHDEGPGCLEHRSIRAIGARVGRLLSDRGAGVGRVLSGKRAIGPGWQNGKSQPPRMRLARSCSDPTRDWWASSMMLWPIMRSRPWRLVPGKPQVWAVGERVHARLADANLPLMGLFTVPNSVKTITPLVGQILVESETRHSQGCKSLNSTSSTTGPRPESVYTHPSVSVCYRWTKPGDARLVELPWPTR